MTQKPVHWKVLSEKLLVDCHIYRVFAQHCIHPVDRREGTFYVIRCNDWVQVLPITENGELILVNQYRFGTQQLSWEVPGGVIDDIDTSPEVAAARELIEETGYSGEPGHVIGRSYPNPALQANEVYFVLIENCKKVAEQNLDANEELEIETVPIKVAINMCKNKEINHAIAMNSIFHLQMHYGL